MIRLGSALTIAATAVFAACSGPGGVSSLPAGSTLGAPMRVLAPQAAPVSAIRHIYGRLNFDGTTFTEVADANCGHRGLGGMTPYTAPASGALVLGSSISVTPRCVPSPAPSNPPQIYVFAIQLHAHHGGHGGGAHFNGVVVAGPANLTDNPWIFAPASPGLTMVAGAKYDFVIATMWSHPTHGGK